MHESVDDIARRKGWPANVKVMSIDQDDLGYDAITGELYWKGRRVVTAKRLELRWFEWALAIFATIGTFGSFMIEALKWALT
jgi:hypothetical protein